MLEENLSTDEETGSEIFLDALDKEKSTDNLTRRNDNNEHKDFETSLCIWKDIGVPFQIYEARVVLNNCPKCNRIKKCPEKNHPSAKKLEDVVVTCRIQDEKKLCPVCLRKMDQCVCGNVRADPSGFPLQKKSWCTSYKPTRLYQNDSCRPLKNNMDIITVLRNISKISTSLKYQSSLTSEALVNVGSDSSKNAVCKTKKKLSKLSYFSSEELQLVHNLNRSEIAETLKNKKCLCNDQKPKSFPISEKLNIKCACSKLKHNFVTEGPKARIYHTPSRIPCVCVKKKQQKYCPNIQEKEETKRKIRRPKLPTVKKQESVHSKTSSIRFSRKETRVEKYETEDDQEPPRTCDSKREITSEQNIEQIETKYEWKYIDKESVFREQFLTDTEKTNISQTKTCWCPANENKSVPEQKEKCIKQETLKNLDKIIDKIEKNIESFKPKNQVVFKTIEFNLDHLSGKTVSEPNISSISRYKEESTRRTTRRTDDNFLVHKESENKYLSNVTKTVKANLSLNSEEDIEETRKKENRTCECHVEEQHSIDSKNTKLCKKCSRIPISTSKFRKELPEKKICFNTTSTNTTIREITEKGLQCEEKIEINPICKNCRRKTESLTTTTQLIVVGNASTTVGDGTRLARYQTMGCLKRSSAFFSPKKKLEGSDTSIKCRCQCKTCTKTCQRPSTASKVEDLRRKEIVCYKRPLRDPAESTSQLCQTCRECKLQNENMHNVEVNTDRRNMVNIEQQCVNISVTKQCHQSQTGGTFEQDIIACYVASCTSQQEIPQQFMIQSLLYQFAGNDTDKDRTKRRGHTQATQCENAMRSIQVQVGPDCSPKCTGAQTIASVTLTKPAEGKVNVCRPASPGIRTKIAMNLNQLQAEEDSDSCICSPTCANEHEKHSNQRRPQYQMIKKDNCVFITVSPVQTDPCELNNCIIMSAADDSKKKPKLSKSCKILKNHPNIACVSRTDPLDRFKNQMLSEDSLRSKEFLDSFTKSPDVGSSEVIRIPCEAMKSICMKALIAKAREEQQRKRREVEERGCGPETCEYFKEQQQKERMKRLEKTTRTVSCGSEYCLYQKQLNAQNKRSEKKLKDAECGPDTCDLKKQKNPVISIQTEDLPASCKPSKGIVVTIVACDAFTNTDNSKTCPRVKYSEKQICTNEIVRGNAGNQVRFEDKKKKNAETTVLYRYCDASCEAYSEESSMDEMSCESQCDPGVCLDNGEQNEAKVQEVCKECTEQPKREEDVMDAMESFGNDTRCKLPLCPKKLNTKLDALDVFKLQKAMDKFIKVNPKLDDGE